MSMWSLRWHFTNKGHLTVLKVTVCHTAGHYGEEYDDWNMQCRLEVAAELQQRWRRKNRRRKSIPHLSRNTTLLRCTYNNFSASADFRLCTAAFYPQWLWRHVDLWHKLNFFSDYWYVLWLNWRTFRLWTMLKQLLNGNNGLLLILNNTDFSLTCRCWVFLWLWRSVIVSFSQN